MTDNGLNLTLPDRKRRGGRPAYVGVLLLALLAVGIANLVVAWRGGARGERSPARGLGTDASRELALKLEKQGLRRRAAEVWKEHLAGEALTSAARAKVWYRIGKLHQEAAAYEDALAAYYRSEKVARLPDLEAELNRRAQECLEAAGRFAALRADLVERTAVEGQGGDDPIVAEIGRRRITKTELDRRIEAYIEQQLQTLASLLPDEQRQAQKERLLNDLASGSRRRAFLDQWLLHELLYRKAREDGLAETDDVRRMLTAAERGVLAGQVLQKEFAARIHITPSDLRTYYEAHKKDYVERSKDKDGKEQERQRPFDEVSGQVYQMLRAVKEREIRAALSGELQRKYDVVIHASQLGGREDGKKTEAPVQP